SSAFLNESKKQKPAGIGPAQKIVDTGKSVFPEKAYTPTGFHMNYMSLQFLKECGFCIVVTTLHAFGQIICSLARLCQMHRTGLLKAATMPKHVAVKNISQKHALNCWREVAPMDRQS